MREYADIRSWISATGGSRHEITVAESLPTPAFLRDGRETISFSSNNYLGLAHHPRLVRAAKRGLDRYGVANCESRLLGGDLQLYQDLEGKIAKVKGKESAMLFATGYLTNLGVLSSLTNAGAFARFYGFRPCRVYKYVYFSDEFNHVSIREGIRMSGSQRVSFKHRDLNDLEAKLRTTPADLRIIVSDGVFSMDGDIAPLPGLIDLAERYDAMIYIDDAHGTGVLGRTGAGIAEHFSVDSPRVISMGTLSKAYGAIGGFIACSSLITGILRFTCSAYGFTSTLTPDQACAVSEAIDIIDDEPGLRERLWANQRSFVMRIQEIGLPVLSAESAIVPVLIGDERRCEAISKALGQDGLHVDSVLFPAVPMGMARLRFNMNTHHTQDHQQRLMDSLTRALASKDAARPYLRSAHARSCGSQRGQ